MREEGGRGREVIASPHPPSFPVQLFISYVDLLDPRSKRQKALLEGWYFTCACSRCTEVSGQGVLIAGPRFILVHEIRALICGHTCQQWLALMDAPCFVASRSAPLTIC